LVQKFHILFDQKCIFVQTYKNYLNTIHKVNYIIIIIYSNTQININHCNKYNVMVMKKKKHQRYNYYNRLSTHMDSIIMLKNLVKHV